jgi:hypothetical protein
VLPAGVTAGLRARGAFGEIAAAGIPSGGGALGKLEQAIGGLTVEVEALRRKVWNVEVRTPGIAGTLGAIGRF